MSSDFMTHEYNEITSLYKVDKDILEGMIENELQKHMRTFEWFTYFIIDKDHLLVKVLDEKNVPIYTVKMRLYNNRLIVESVD